MIDTLQALAELVKTTYHLSLRVAEHDGNFYYDLMDDEHRCIKISKKESDWKIQDTTPVPLFRRYNQVFQDIFEAGFEKNNEECVSKYFEYTR